MTTLGKALVLINVALALTFLAWATGLYTNQIFWHTPQSTDGQTVKGLVKQLQDRIEELKPGREAAERRWAEAVRLVAVDEALRPKLQQDYADRLPSVRRGDVPDIKPP